jgi:hypothetical protein
VGFTLVSVWPGGVARGVTRYRVIEGLTRTPRPGGLAGHRGRH